MLATSGVWRTYEGLNKCTIKIYNTRLKKSKVIYAEKDPSPLLPPLSPARSLPLSGASPDFVTASSSPLSGFPSLPSGEKPLGKRHALQILTKRFYSVKHRCGRARFYRHVSFGFGSARKAAEYMFENFGPLPLDNSASTSSRLRTMTIDRIDGRRGYEPGNLRYATIKQQIANRRFRARDQAALNYPPQQNVQTSRPLASGNSAGSYAPLCEELTTP